MSSINQGDLAGLIRDNIAALEVDDGPFARLRRQSQASLLQDVTGEDASGTRLELRFGGSRVVGHRAPADQLYEVLEALQRATALVGDSLRPTVTDPQRITDQRIGRHQLDVLAPSPGSVVLTVVPASEPPDLFGHEPTTWAEMALAQLVGTLPDDEDEDGDLLSEAAQGAILASTSTVRAALAALARSIERTDADLTLTLRRPSRVTTRSRLGRRTARLVLAIADEPITLTERHRYEGTLDGLRTRKRMFWLILDNGEEISGGIPERLLGAVRANLGQRVSVDVESTRQGPEGRLGRPRHILSSLGMTTEDQAERLNDGPMPSP
ncbi:hypothetical protein DQ244_17250 [Blastococcus sp. TBT05-19]|uniref:hypothetical protein n=1 Tax=Blastococcus sp. TBT05-19 TaxID=2250581 RepID=UPI000DE917B8|nr:hypothetical protein [Blastococcus sp. TBT05-19]RBY87085.1 hypothetical protein DQ244_17250 [Blastococcus sp. TBT05-19]